MTGKLNRRELVKAAAGASFAAAAWGQRSAVQPLRIPMPCRGNRAWICYMSAPSPIPTLPSGI